MALRRTSLSFSGSKGLAAVTVPDICQWNERNKFMILLHQIVTCTCILTNVLSRIYFNFPDHWATENAMNGLLNSLQSNAESYRNLANVTEAISMCMSLYQIEGIYIPYAKDEAECHQIADTYMYIYKICWILCHKSLWETNLVTDCRLRCLRNRRFRSGFT